MIPRQILRILLVLLGVGLFLFGLFDLVVPRAHFVSSNPAPGASIAEVPSFVTVSFSNKLAPQSQIRVTSTIELLPTGEQNTLAGGSVILKSEIDPGDPTGRSMRAQLQPGLHKGLYWVNWTTRATGWGTRSYGKTVFAVGMNVPEHVTSDMNGFVWERNYDFRGRRAALIGGVVMLALGLFLTSGKK